MGQTPKQYAISLGLAKEGKGRMSLAAHAAIDKAISEGVVFDIPVAQQAKVKKPAIVTQGADTAFISREIPKPTPPRVQEDGPLNVAEARYSDSQKWRSTSGFIVGGRSVCTESGFSLQYCSCDKPKSVINDGSIEELVLV